METMRLTTRTTREFIEIEVNEIKTTLFMGDRDVNLTIMNLMEVINDLSHYTNKSINELYRELTD